MIDRDLVELLVALALIVACAASAVASASPSRAEPSAGRERVPRARRRRDAPPPAPAATAPQEVIAPGPATVNAEPSLASSSGRARPRILTGEPAAPEPLRPASHRAIKLVGGVTVLALGGAVGLLVLVRALVAMFQGIGG